MNRLGVYSGPMSEERRQMRQQFIDIWHKRQDQELLSPFEIQVLDTLYIHPEYQTLLEDPNTLDKDYTTDNNPFLHLSLHLGVIEQLSTNRPTGIREIYQSLQKRLGDDHQAQHRLMEVMAEVIWEAQQLQQVPNDKAYLTKLKKLEVNT